MAADTLDNVIGRGLASAKPTSPLAEGYIYHETDTGKIVRYSGSSWEVIGAEGLATTKGDILVYDGTDLQRLAIGSDDDVLTADSTESTGIKWAAGGGGGGGGGLSSGQVWPMKQLYTFASYFSGNINQGGGASQSGSTDAAATDTERLCNSFTNAGTSLMFAYVAATVPQPRHCPDMRWDHKLVDNDDGIMWGGLWDQATLPGTGVSDLGSAGIEAAVVRAKNGTDTNFQFITSDGSTQTVTDTGVAIDANWHDFRVYTDDNGVTWKCEIDGTEVASVTTNVPATTSAMCTMLGNVADTSSTRVVHLSYMGCWVGDSNLGI